MKMLMEMSFKQKLKINESQRRRILVFLVHEIYTTLKNLALLIERDYTQTYRLCSKMADEDLLRFNKVTTGAFKNTVIVGITVTGASKVKSLFLNKENIKAFQPSKICSTQKLGHQLKIQKFRAINSAKMYNLGQLRDFMSYPVEKSKPEPDLILHMDNQRTLFCVEIECTQKSKLRYEDIIDLYKRRGEHVLYMFDNLNDLLSIGTVIAKLVPNNWPIETFFLFSTIEIALKSKQIKSEWEQDGQYFYKNHNQLSVLVAIDYRDLVNNNPTWNSYDFHPFTANTLPLRLNKHPETMETLDSKGRVVPVVTILEWAPEKMKPEGNFDYLL